MNNNLNKLPDENLTLYHIMLVMMLGMFIVQPFLREGSFVTRVFYTAILFGAATGAIRNQQRWLGYVILTLIIFDIFWTKGSLIFALIAYLLAIGVYLRQIFSYREITSEIISLALCVYLMFGIAWMLAYLSLLQIQPDTFRSVGDAPVDPFYYSFVTLTTLGYGDITPTTKIAKSLACLEALTGQIYLVAIVARLVGLIRAPTESKVQLK